MSLFRIDLTAMLMALSLLGCSTAPLAGTMSAVGQQQASAGANSSRLGIGLFEGDAKTGALVVDVLMQDLRRGAAVSVVDATSIRLGADTRPDWESWRAAGVGTFLAGSIKQKPDGTFNVRARLWSLDGFRDIAGMEWNVTSQDMRLVAHALADFVQEKLTGTPGQYSERRISVSRKDSRYVMSITDSDGAGAQAALASPRPILMPTWLSDKQFIAYVSLETSVPTVWMHDVNTGMRAPAAAAMSLVGECPAATRFLSIPPEVNPPTELLDDGWASMGGAACKGALSALAKQAEANLARQRLGIRTSISPKPDNEMTYAERVARTVRRNVVFDTSSLIGNPEVVVRMKVSPDGFIADSTVDKSSGLTEWDDAALRAVRKTERLPFDANGKAPSVLILHMRPLL
ncbi:MULTISPECIES: TonB family protein [unclassified Variovorax]|jgi:TonB family protein|uniref:TonB family protein n=1 Tax=unclassified Variovorax TaxID=663243 RepID=UPI000F7E5794|nr:MULTISPECIES: TonB family protein [unclassified Variovorax]RSZ38530.1 TonB family protein [Variovorax sp. 553]RSZ39019.1 TonB family protein [Variovorax sp. 679]